MKTDRQQQTRRPYRRVSRLDGQKLNIGVSRDQRAALEAAADSAGLSVAEVARQCIDRGLPLVRDSLRKARKREQTN